MPKIFLKFTRRETFIEEGIIISKYGNKISKKLKVFYNKEMKLNRDLTLLIIDKYFQKPIIFCDPLCASGIREMRFLNVIPNKFKKIILGDISKSATKDIKKNFKRNKISLKKVTIRNQDATISLLENFYDFIEIDPFGSPVPFLDIACQRIKHNGILSVTATDVAALCGTYPKTCFRKYSILTKMTPFYDELGLRNLIAYIQKQGAKYEKKLTPLISYSIAHYYKIFFVVEQSRTKSLEQIKQHSYFSQDKKTQEIILEKYQNKDSLGKTYINSLNNKDFLKKLDINLTSDNIKVKKIISKLDLELDLFGSINIHLLKKNFKIKENKTFDEIITSLQKMGYLASKTSNAKFNIKTNAKIEDIIKVIQAKN